MQEGKSWHDLSQHLSHKADTVLAHLYTLVPTLKTFAAMSHQYFSNAPADLVCEQLRQAIILFGCFKHLL
jgi:hypothetical protein